MRAYYCQIVILQCSKSMYPSVKSQNWNMPHQFSPMLPSLVRSQKRDLFPDAFMLYKEVLEKQRSA